MTTHAVKHRTILHFVRADSDHAVFSREEDERENIAHVFLVAKDKWIDLGKPETITVTLEPGDKLNP